MAANSNRYGSATPPLSEETLGFIRRSSRLKNSDDSLPRPDLDKSANILRRPVESIYGFRRAKERLVSEGKIVDPAYMMQLFGNLRIRTLPDDRGLLQKEMKAYLVESPHTLITGTDKKVSCAICMVDFIEFQNVCELDCCHKYHIACIKKWLRSNTTCPICRKSVAKKIYLNCHGQLFSKHIPTLRRSATVIPTFGIPAIT